MTDKITLTNLVNLQNENTAVAAINANNAVITSAFDNTLSLNGQAPNQMQSTLDMNSNQIINLPAPSTTNSPARLIDVVSNPTIVVPGTGTSGHVVPFLDGNNAWTGTNTYSAASTFNGPAIFNGSTTFPGGISNSNLSTMPNNTVKGNLSGGTSFPTDVTLASLITALNLVNSFGGQTGAILLNAPDLAMSGNTLQLSAARRTTPTSQTFLSGSGTYTKPANAIWLRVRLIGGGGGGGTTAAGNGTSTTFGPLTGSGGTGGAGGTTGGPGGTGTGGSVLNLQGGAGGCGGGTLVSNIQGASGGNGYFGGAGTASNSVAIVPTANTGAGGSAADNQGTGGGAGGYCEHIFTSPANTYSYSVGTGGSQGTNGTAGATGVIIVEEYYN